MHQPCFQSDPGHTTVAPLDAMAKTFYGFGRWDAPFWFIGAEQGMARVGDCLDQRCRCWTRLGRRELVDCKKFHQCLGLPRFHEPPYPLQPTWRRLILLLLAFKGEACDKNRIREYQAQRWGVTSSAGETCVADLSGIAAHNLKCKSDKKKFLSGRVATLRKRIDEHQPNFVVAYGLSSRAAFEQLAGGAFELDRGLNLGKSVILLTPAPTAFGYTDRYWAHLGKLIRKLCDSHANEQAQTHASCGG